DKAATDWSPDGKYVLFDANDRKSNSRWDVWVLPLTGERQPFPFVSTPAVEREAHFSPDGKWIAYSSDESGKNEIDVAPFPATGAKWQVASNGGFICMWNPDGKEIIYITPDLTVMSVGVTMRGSTIDLASPRLLYTRKDGVGGALGRDGKILILLRPEI